MHDRHLKITVFSHHFSVTELTARGRSACYNFSNRLVAYAFIPQGGRMIRQATKVYAARTDDKCEFRFHINMLKDFKTLLQAMNIDEKLYSLIEVPMYEGKDVELSVKPEWIARDYQIPIIDYLQQKKPISKMVSLQTGQGKSFVAMKAISNIKKRTVIVIKPTFIEKWIEDIMRTYSDVTLEDILVVRGGDQLMALLELAKHDQIDAKFIIISNRTYQNWIKMYEKYHFESLDMGYACLPIEMYQSLKAGIKLIDEAHLEFHSVFKHELYTHVPSSVALTATLISDDPLVSNMHKVVFPTADRYKEIELIKYIDSYAVHYRFNNPDKIRTSEYGSKNFSMNAVETSIMRHIPTLNKYLQLVEYCFSISYLKVKRDKKKCIIFAYTKEMCGLIVDHLKKKYPQFDIRRYVGEDPWENLMNADVTATTIGSAGTGVDIPDLTTAIMTTSVNSTSSNIQTFGRLRQLKDNHPVEFLYLVSEDIPKMVQYHYSKKQILQQRCKTFRDIYSGHVV